MKHAYLGIVLDVSLPVPDEPQAVAQLDRGLRQAMQILEANAHQRVEVALAGAVTLALLRNGREGALQRLAERASFGQVSFLSTACYGAFLPLVPPAEAARQLALNDAVNRDALGDFVYCCDGLFPPQLGYSRSVADLAFARGLSRVLLDDLAYRGGIRPLPRDRHFTLAGRDGFHLFFADRALSALVADGSVRDAEGIHAILHERRSMYSVLRIPGRLLVEDGLALGLLESFARQTRVMPATFEELLALFPEFEVIEPLPCALGTDPTELAAGSPFAKWSAPGNELHALLWRLAQLASAEAERLQREGSTDPAAGALRSLLDESLDCAPWRYASGKPEFDPMRVRDGGRRLIDAIRAGGDAVAPGVLSEAEAAYQRLEARCAELAARGGVGEAHDQPRA